ncbi:MAG: sugar phosphate nucleotidyltransferase [Sandaracinaceae bacterium]
MVFAAGLGTRLHPLTEERPKAAVPILDRPLAAYALERLAAASIDPIAVSLFHLAEVAQPLLRAALPRGPEVLFVREPRLLGTGGGLRHAMAALDARFGPSDEPVVVMNGDVLMWPDLEAAVRRHHDAGAWATMVVRHEPGRASEGRVRADEEGRVRQLLGEPAATRPLTGWTFTGVQVLSPGAIAELPAEGCVVRQAYRGWVDRRERVLAVEDEAPWRDVGTPSAYRRACLEVANGDLRWPSVVPAPDGVWLGPGAIVAGARVRRSVVGGGAMVAPGVTVEGSVLWPGARAERDVHETVLTTAGRSARS